MKYSVIMPYYKRPELMFTLRVYVELYKNRNDIEIIVVEDSKNNKDKQFHDQLISIINTYKNDLNIKLVLDHKVSYNPSSKYNLGFKVSTGLILMLTSPEIFHTVNIFDAIDKENMNNLYIICSCKSVFLEGNKGGTFKDIKFRTNRWYQHTKFRDVRYHFCTLVSKSDYEKIGGFNEVYCAGIAYDDDNFVKRVQKAGLVMLPRDELVTYHIEHSRSYSITPEEYKKLLVVNRNIWASQVATGIF